MVVVDVAGGYPETEPRELYGLSQHGALVLSFVMEIACIVPIRSQIHHTYTFRHVLVHNWCLLLFTKQFLWQDSAKYRFPQKNFQIQMLIWITTQI